MKNDTLSETLTLRLAPDMMKRLDKAKERAVKRVAGARFTRLDVVRMLLEQALVTDEASK